MAGLSASVVILCSVMGGATTALALAGHGVDVLVLERGGHLPRESQNWSRRAAFIDRRHKPAGQWLDRRGKPFHPGVQHVVGGNTKVYGASLPGFRESDFSAVEHLEGTSPTWPFTTPIWSPTTGNPNIFIRYMDERGKIRPSRGVARRFRISRSSTSPTSLTWPPGSETRARNRAATPWAWTGDRTGFRAGSAPRGDKEHQP